ncbi:MAG TPA: hypothetical protein VFG84_02825, partial [Gemmatimonadaceae bacterium]|nr:hypothetical protein [Gemmatimonadaceae bacterium]
MSTFAVALLAASGAGAARAQNALPQSTLRGETELADGFTEITHIRELSDGRVLVLDQRESRIALADFMAGTVVQVGRDGDGPGENRSPVLIVPLRGDTTLAWDFIGARTSLFAPSANGGGRIAGTTTRLRNVRGPPRFLPRG